jgi:photosystem II stability/assembly factor-like uncharacterized protein
MKCILTFLFVCTIVFIACKKEKIKPQQSTTISTGTTANLYKVLITKDNTIVVTGGKRYETSEILISRDNGNTWQLESIPEAGKALHTICQGPNGNLFATGIDSKLLISKDDGKTWQLRQLSIWKPCNGIAFDKKYFGYVISDEAQKKGIIATINIDGEILNKQEYPFGLNDIQLDGDTVFISGYGAILKTTNQGQTWQYLDIKNDNFTAIAYTNTRKLWVCGSGGSIYRSYDAGNSWERLRNGNSITKKKYVFRDIIFINDNEGWAIGDEGLIIQTKDAGDTWTEIEQFTKAGLRSITPMQDGTLLICGEQGGLYKLKP